MAQRKGLFQKAREQIEDRTGYQAVPRRELSLLEASDQERRILQKELDMIGWSVLDYVSGSGQEIRTTERRKMVQQARMVWTKDPQAGAVVDLMADFIFGRGVPQPKAKDPKVQEVIDEAWTDGDTQLILTSHAAQVALLTDLMLQANVFFLVFDEGDDGKVKLGLLDHDTVETVVRDPDNRLRILYYVARTKRTKWNYKTDTVEISKEHLDPEGRPRVKYFEHFRNVRDAEDAGIDVEKPPAEKLGEGLVYHLAINRTSEMAFGVPPFQRIIRFMSAFNDWTKARLDLMRASAALMMRREVKGTPEQVAKIAAKALSRRSDLAAMDIDGTEMLAPPRTGSILNENQEVKTEQMKIDTGAGNAQLDAQMIRSQTSAAVGFPQSYMGDASAGTLATATAIELRVLKRVEAVQELFEQLFRFYIDHVIEKAVDSGKISKHIEDDEDERAKKENRERVEEYHGEVSDEDKTERDLSYDFGMPSPLRRMMTDLINSIATIAKTFDPNGTNVELSRVLLTIGLGEGLEMADPGEAVEKIFPPGYEDPAFAQPSPFAPQQPGGNPFGSAEMGPQGEGNPYSAPMQAQPPNVAMRQAAYRETPLGAQTDTDARKVDLEKLFDEEISQVAATELAKLMVSSPNGKH